LLFPWPQGCNKMHKGRLRQNARKLRTVLSV